jgi:hypothetical protein
VDVRWASTTSLRTHGGGNHADAEAATAQREREERLAITFQSGDGRRAPPLGYAGNVLNEDFPLPAHCDLPRFDRRGFSWRPPPRARVGTLHPPGRRPILAGMIRMPQLPQPTWAIYRAASKTVWFGDVDAVDEADAIAKAAEQFKVPATKLIAIKRT